MPALKAAKRKATPSGHDSMPITKNKKYETAATRDDGDDLLSGRIKPGDPSLSPSPPAVLMSERAGKFVFGLAARLAGEERDTFVKDSFRAALAALPKGKLKRELEKDEASTLRLLAGEVHRLKPAVTAAATAEPGAAAAAAGGVGTKTKGRGKKRERSAEKDEDETGISVAIGAEGTDIVPCTRELYSRARSQAEKQLLSGGDSKGSNTSSSAVVAKATTKKTSSLKTLALNPRAPLDLLIDAMDGTETPGGALKTPTSVQDTVLHAALDGMRNLVAALATDPRAAMSVSGLAFYADRAAALAESVSVELAATQGGRWAPAGLMSSTATEAMGLMLRILHVAGLATTAAAVEATATIVADHAADTLLLPCVPETTQEAAGGNGAKVLPPHQAVARLLAHYAIAMGVCSTVDWNGGVPAFIKSVQAASMGGRGSASNAQGERRVSDGNCSDSESSDSEEEALDEGERLSSASGWGGGGGGGSALSSHLLTLCAIHLAGRESTTLEFVRCVGDACYTGGARPRLSPAVAASLAPTCALALVRLPRPVSSPAPSATLFLRRAYASRIVHSLLLESSSYFAAGGVGSGKGGGELGGRRINFPAAASRPWDFVGAAAAPRALLEFLGRPEAVAAVEGAAGGAGAGAGAAALKQLAKRRDSPRAVEELLRSSEACAPCALGPLLEAMESLGGEEECEASGDGKGEAGYDVVALGGFFVDTAGAGGEQRKSEAVSLAPLRGGPVRGDADGAGEEIAAGLLAAMEDDRVEEEEEGQGR